MSAQLYVVLRKVNDTVETIGPAGAKFDSFEEADRYAKALRDRYTAQNFVVCEAICAYATEMMATVTKFGSDSQKSKRARKAPKQKEAAKKDTDNEDVFPMHARKAAGQ